MKKIDYNKIIYVMSVIFLILFVIFLIKDYLNYNTANGLTYLYKKIIIRGLQFVLPSAIFAYLYNQNTYLKQSNYIVKTRKKLDKFNGYKIAHLSDFHNTSSNRLKNKIIKTLEKNKPDIIVITGDLIDSRRTNIIGAKEFVKKLVNIAPTYYVLGNHEARLKNINEYEEEIKETNLIILRNRKITITKDNQHITLIGLDDPALYKNIQDEYEIKERLDYNIKEQVNNKEQFNILLIHRPEYFTIYSNNCLDLVFAGHAHGGQARIPFIGGIIAPGQGIFPKYTNGIHEMNNTKLVISRGIGNSAFPFRINNRPEIVFVTLKT